MNYPKFRKIGRNNYPIEYPLLDVYYNPLYSVTYNRIYYGCPKKCKVCKQWKKKGEVWKGLYFFPIHCHLCEYAGNQEDFEIENIFILCKNCLKIKKQLILNIKNFSNNIIFSQNIKKN